MCFKFGNIVPQAILIRAIKPEIGIETMLKRRNKTKVIPSLTNGPSSVCQALGITREHYGFFLDKKNIWLEDRGFLFLMKKFYNPHELVLIMHRKMH